MFREEKVVGPEHRLTLNSRANLVVALIAGGKWHEAEGQYTDILKLMQRTLGIDYPDTVTYTLKFAEGMAQQNKVDKAAELLASAAETARQQLGPDNLLANKYTDLRQKLVSPPH